MNILLLGSGGRESALAWKLAQSKKLTKLWIAPGNAGTSLYGTNLALAETDFNGIKLHVLETDIDMIVVGPEAPLAEGIVDFFRDDGLLGHVKIIGPSQYGARLESSKDFAKEFMNRHAIPTARHQTFTKETLDDGYRFLETLMPPFVLKADGLAAGKGVVICQNLSEAREWLYEMLAGRKFGKASESVVVEEFLQGIELSVFVLTDGKHYVNLPNAKDYKRIGEGDTGPNTGGMGSVSPVPFANKEFMLKVEEQIIKPTVLGIQNEKIDYCGFIFFGLMNCAGDPYVIEYNVRLGDPESEAIIPRINNDLVEVFEKTAQGRLDEVTIETSGQYAVAVMLVSGGYPGEYEKGKVVKGIDNVKDGVVFHAGTKTNDSAEIITNGGRVLAVTAMADSLELALKRTYASAALIKFDGMNYRRDIGIDLLEYQDKPSK
ncbi:MAG: phosphoribosylamine--glycine ligase [Bacteroidales bacterium]|nr:phosphoribosylamine--glycine ligase [Bacteroidales bacterium]